MAKREVKRLHISGGVLNIPRRCDGCTNMINVDNWYKNVRVSYVVGMDTYHRIHDTKVCEEKLKVELGMCVPNFYSTRHV